MRSVTDDVMMTHDAASFLQRERHRESGGGTTVDLAFFHIKLGEITVEFDQAHLVIVVKGNDDGLGGIYFVFVKFE